MVDESAGSGSRGVDVTHCAVFDRRRRPHCPVGSTLSATSSPCGVIHVRQFGLRNSQIPSQHTAATPTIETWVAALVTARRGDRQVRVIDGWTDPRRRLELSGLA